MATDTKYEFTKVDLVNHSVKFNNSELLQFFYPEFKNISENSIVVNGPSIYRGGPENLNRIKSFGYPVISVTTLGEFDLSSNRTLVNMTFTKWNTKPSDRLCKYVDKLDYDELLEAVKIHWVSGRWTMRKYSKSGAFINIAEAFTISTIEVLKTYLKLLDSPHCSGAYVEKSLFSFLEKICSNSKGNTPWYDKILRQYRMGKKDLLYQAVDKYVKVNIQNKDLKIFNLLQDLNRKDRRFNPE